MACVDVAGGDAAVPVVALGPGPGPGSGPGRCPGPWARRWARPCARPWGGPWAWGLGLGPLALGPGPGPGLGPAPPRVPGVCLGLAVARGPVAWPPRPGRDPPGDVVGRVPKMTMGFPWAFPWGILWGGSDWHLECAFRICVVGWALGGMWVSVPRTELTKL